jgi:flagellar hook assembly protein FlgD
VTALAGAVGVKLIIYDITGRIVTTLLDEQKQPGTYEVEWDAGNYASGIYFYSLISGGYRESKKMVLIK